MTTETPTRPPKSNDDALADLRTVAARVGRPMSWKAYNEQRDVGMLQSHSVMGRFSDSWSGVCRRAGVEPGAQSRPTYARQYDDDALRTAVRTYLASEGASGSYADFVRWTTEAEGRPSAATVRTHLGKWSDVKASVA